MILMNKNYVHGYDPRENIRLQDQASTLVELLHFDTSYPAGSQVLEAGCGTGAQTITLARNSPDAHITSIDISESSVVLAKKRIEGAGFTNVNFQQGDIFNLTFEPGSFDHIFVCFVLEHLAQPSEALNLLKKFSKLAEQSPLSKEIMGRRIFILTMTQHIERFNVRLSYKSKLVATLI